MEDAKAESSQNIAPKPANPVPPTNSRTNFPSGGIQFIPPSNPGMSFMGISRSYSMGKLFLAFMLLLALPTTVYLMQQKTRVDTIAATHSVHFFITPPTNNLPPDKTISIMLDSRLKSVKYVNTVVSFDPTAVQMTGEIQPAKWLKYVIRKTPAEEANQTGKLVVSLGLLAGDEPTSGPIELFKLPLAAQGTYKGETLINFVNNEIIVNNEKDLSLMFTAMPGVVRIGAQ